MFRNRKITLFLLMSMSVLIAGEFIQMKAIAKEEEIILLVRGDDIGAGHAINQACIESYKNGIVRSVELLVPGPWFTEAVKLLRENPNLDVGVHLDLTSEWENYKWGPITEAPSLVDALGHFLPMTSQRSDFPPGTGFMQSSWKIGDVEKELRAQIETAKRNIPWVSHLSSHMGTPTCTPELRDLVMKLAKEYQLPLEIQGFQHVRGFSGSDKTGEQKENDLIQILETMKPGRWLLIEHPGLDTPEMRGMGHIGYWNVAQDRAGVTQAFTSEKVRAIIQKRRILLTSYKYKEV